MSSPIVRGLDIVKSDQPAESLLISVVRSPMYSPPASLTRFFFLSMILSVPSGFHCPISPVLR